MKSQIELKNTKTEIKNTLEGINSRLEDIEVWIRKLEDRVMEITEAELKKETRIKRNKDSLRDLWDNIKHANIHIIGVSKEEKEKGAEILFEEIIDEKLP